MTEHTAGPVGADSETTIQRVTEQVGAAIERLPFG